MDGGKAKTFNKWASLLCFQKDAAGTKTLFQPSFLKDGIQLLVPCSK
jgi:hypothetical protein